MKRILLVEDDYFIRDIYSRVFSQAGYAVDIAVDGQKAIDKANANTYDLILLDIMLPNVTGIDVLKTYRNPNSPTKDTPVFLITNLGQDDIIKEAFRIGADGYLLKAQLKPEEIVNEVNTFFSKQHASTNRTKE